jgi:hypothetical protein
MAEARAALMTVCTTDISVLHSAEVAHLYPQSRVSLLAWVS